MTSSIASDAVRSLLDAAARRYRPAGRSAYFFALGKLRFDPVFAALVRQIFIPSGTRVLDLGCGQALLFACLLEAEERYRNGAWPADWPAPPLNLQLHGIERQSREAGWAKTALGASVRVETADLCQSAFPPSDVVILIDVLHYFEAGAQLALLDKISECLAPGGRVLLRVANVRSHLRVTLAADRLGAWIRGHPRPRYHVRPVDEWRRLMEGLGFSTSEAPMGGGTPFRNVLLVAERAGTPG